MMESFGLRIQLEKKNGYLRVAVHFVIGGWVFIVLHIAN